MQYKCCRLGKKTHCSVPPSWIQAASCWQGYTLSFLSYGTLFFPPPFSFLAYVAFNIVYFLKDLFISQSYRERKLVIWLTLQMSTMAKGRPDLGWDPGASFSSPMWRSPRIWVIFCCFSQMFSRQLDQKPSSNDSNPCPLGRQHCKQWLYQLCHNTSPSNDPLKSGKETLHVTSQPYTCNT